MPLLTTSTVPLKKNADRNDESFDRCGLPVAAAAVAPATATTSSATPAAEPPTSSAASGTAPAATTAFAGGTRFVDDKIAAAEVLAVQSLDGLVRFLVTLDLDEAKTAGLPRKAVTNEGHTGGSNAGLHKPLTELLLGCLKGEIAHIELLHLLTPSARGRQSPRDLAEEANTKTRAV